MTHKTCTVCGESKLLEEFYAHKGGKYGRQSNCKNCLKAKVIARQKIRYHTDAEFRTKHKAASLERIKRHLVDPEFREREYARNREWYRKKYAENPEFRKRRSERNTEYQDKKREKAIAKAIEEMNK